MILFASSLSEAAPIKNDLTTAQTSAIPIVVKIDLPNATVVLKKLFHVPFRNSKIQVADHNFASSSQVRGTQTALPEATVATERRSTFSLRASSSRARSVALASFRSSGISAGGSFSSDFFFYNCFERLINVHHFLSI